MKPTKEVIELSKKLYELGYMHNFNPDEYIWLLHVESDIVTQGHRVERSYNEIPIPSISDGVDFLREKGERFFPNLFTEKPWEEMLMAMIRVMEEK